MNQLIISPPPEKNNKRSDYFQTESFVCHSSLINFINI